MEIQVEAEVGVVEFDGHCDQEGGCSPESEFLVVGLQVTKFALVMQGELLSLALEPQVAPGHE